MTSLVFALTDDQGSVVGLTITEPLNINDSHKDKKYKRDDDKNKTPPPKPVIETQGLPGEGVFPQQPGTFVFQPQLPQSRSAPNLSAAPQDFNFQQTAIYNSQTPPVYNNFTNTFPWVPTTITPNRSRPASPSAPTNPAKRQRGQGNDRRVPNNLVMTPISGESSPVERHPVIFNFYTTNVNFVNHASENDINNDNISNGPTMAAGPIDPAGSQTPFRLMIRHGQAGRYFIAKSGMITTLVVLSGILPVSLRVFDKRMDRLACK